MTTNYYYIKTGKCEFYNQKVHDIYNNYITKFTPVEIDLNNLEETLNKLNNSNSTLIFYSENGEGNELITIKMLDYIKSKTILFKLYLFVFDFWIHQKKIPLMILKDEVMINIFKADKFKVICFANSLEQLNLFHGYDYSLYKHNIIFNNIWSCYNSSFCNFNKNPIYKLLISGSRAMPYYNERETMAKCKNNYIQVYDKNLNDLTSGNNHYNVMLNSHFACFSSSVHVMPKDKKPFINTHIILLKTFEILAAGSLLVMPVTEQEYINRIGLVHLKNCYLINISKDLDVQINYIFTNIDLFDKIRFEGLNLAKQHLNSSKKIDEMKKIIEGN